MLPFGYMISPTYIIYSDPVRRATLHLLSVIKTQILEVATGIIRNEFRWFLVMIGGDKAIEPLPRIGIIALYFCACRICSTLRE
jgi:hypothetical protein